jgi:hypothetical protein
MKMPTETKTFWCWMDKKMTEMTQTYVNATYSLWNFQSHTLLSICLHIHVSQQLAGYALPHVFPTIPNMDSFKAAINSHLIPHCNFCTTHKRNCDVTS